MCFRNTAGLLRMPWKHYECSPTLVRFDRICIVYIALKSQLKLVLFWTVFIVFQKQFDSSNTVLMKQKPMDSLLSHEATVKESS